MESQSNLKTLFALFKTQQKHLDSTTEPSSAVYQDNLRAATATIEECSRLVDSLSLFSRNESEDDIASTDLQYLSTQYYLAELTLRDSITDRRAVLKRAQESYENFLSLLDAYSILSKSDQKLQEQYLNNRDEFSLLSGRDATSRRDTKIGRYKQEKQLKAKLELLSQGSSALDRDDSLIREMYRAEIELHTHNTFHNLDLIAQEIRILSLAPPTPSKHPGPNLSDMDARQRISQRETYSDRLDPSLSHLLRNGKAGPILSKDGKPLQPFTLLDARQRLQNGVFRPDHRLPTMTIDEYLAEEKRRGGIIEGGGEQSGLRPEVDEDNFTKADEETVKAREWDEFKEANPRGSGNTLNRGWRDIIMNNDLYDFDRFEEKKRKEQEEEEKGVRPSRLGLEAFYVSCHAVLCRPGMHQPR